MPSVWQDDRFSQIGIEGKEPGCRWKPRGSSCHRHALPIRSEEGAGPGSHHGGGRSHLEPTHLNSRRSCRFDVADDEGNRAKIRPRADDAPQSHETALNGRRSNRGRRPLRQQGRDRRISTGAALTSFDREISGTWASDSRQCTGQRRPAEPNGGGALSLGRRSWRGLAGRPAEREISRREGRGCSFLAADSLFVPGRPFPSTNKHTATGAVLSSESSSVSNCLLRPAAVALPLGRGKGHGSGGARYEGALETKQQPVECPAEISCGDLRTVQILKLEN